MDKQTQTICWQQPTNCLSVFDHFLGLALKGLRDLKVPVESSLELCQENASNNSFMEFVDF